MCVCVRVRKGEKLSIGNHSRCEPCGVVPGSSAVMVNLISLAICMMVQFWCKYYTTVLLGAEERGIQRRNLALFSIFSIPVNLRSHLRIKWHPSMQYNAQGAHIFRMRLSKPFLSSIS